MPLYDYLCECSVVTEARRGVGVKSIPCPACGRTAKRQSVYRVSFRGLPTLGQPNKRQQFADFREASQELGHVHTQRENEAGHPIQTPNYYEIGKARAAKLRKAGIKSLSEVRR